MFLFYQASGIKVLVSDDSLDTVLGNGASGLASLLQVVISQINLQVLNVILAHAKIQYNVD